MKSRRILIVEDDEFSRGVMEKLLQSSGYETQACVNGEEAVERLNREYFDILITDLHMSGIDGFELIRKTKVIQPRLKRILMTGFVSEETNEKAITEEIDGLFHKPIAWEKLLAFLDALLSSKRVGTHPFSHSPNKSKVKPIFRGIALVFIFFLLTLFSIRYSEAYELLYAQYRPSFRSDVRRDCSKSLSSLLTEEQLNALMHIQNSFYKEIIPLWENLLISNIEFRHLVSDPKVDPKILYDRHKKILELQSKLESLSLSYQMKARSIFTDEQLDRLPWDCMLGMETGFGINVGIGRAPRKGYRR